MPAERSAAQQDRCTDCERVKASDEDWRTYDKSEGDELCWGTNCELAWRRLVCGHESSVFAARWWRTWCYRCGRRWWAWPFRRCGT